MESEETDAADQTNMRPSMKPEILLVVRKYRSAVEATRSTPGSKQLATIKSLLGIDNNKKQE